MYEMVKNGMSTQLMNAVLEQNAEALQELLEKGTQLDVVEYHHKDSGRSPTRVVDGSVWTETILKDWAAGARLLTEYFSDMNNMDKVLLSIRSGSAQVLQVLWNHLEEEGRLEYTTTTELEIFQSVMGGMGQIYNKPFEKKDMRSTVFALVNLGVDLSGALPGTFEYEDFRPEGHSLWTRSMGLRNFEYVEAFWPTKELLPHWPRLNETLFSALSFAVGDQVSINDAQLGTKMKNVLLRFLQEFGESWISQVADEPAPDLFRHLKTGDGEGDIIKTEFVLDGKVKNTVFSINRGLSAQTPSVLEYLCSLVEDKPSAWVRLPLYLTPAERAVVWPLWEKMLAVDPHETLLNVLSDYPSAETHQVLLLLQKEMPHFWSQYWERPDLQGVTPWKKWIAFGGKELYV